MSLHSQQIVCTLKVTSRDTKPIGLKTLSCLPSAEPLPCFLCRFSPHSRISMEGDGLTGVPPKAKPCLLAVNCSHSLVLDSFLVAGDSRPCSASSAWTAACHHLRAVQSATDSNCCTPKLRRSLGFGSCIHRCFQQLLCFPGQVPAGHRQSIPDWALLSLLPLISQPPNKTSITHSTSRASFSSLSRNAASPLCSAPLGKPQIFHPEDTTYGMLNMSEAFLSAVDVWTCFTFTISL